MFIRNKFPDGYSVGEFVFVIYHIFQRIFFSFFVKEIYFSVAK